MIYLNKRLIVYKISLVMAIALVIMAGVNKKSEYIFMGVIFFIYNFYKIKKLSKQRK